MFTYVCSVCKKEVKIEDDKIIRNCEHEKSPVIANMSATCVGKGGMSGAHRQRYSQSG